MPRKKDAASPTPSQWIVNPDVDLVETLAKYGRFLEHDYRMAIDSMEIPGEFDEFTEKSNRRFVIVGAKSVPGATAKSVFLCLKLAGPESVMVKAPTLDEGWLIQNVIDHYGKDVETHVFQEHSDELKLSSEWRDCLEKATDIVVFGDEYTAAAFEELETPSRRVWIHGPKFSFGIVKASDFTLGNMEEIGFDFYSYYGEGCLSPKFYVIVGDVTQKQYQDMSAVMQNLYAMAIDEFRNKLPLTRKSELVQQTILANYRSKYVREEKLNSREIFSTLYGDTRFVVVNELEDLEPFIEKWRDRISTVAIEPNDEEALDFLEDQLITRICSIGEMQFPHFFEQFDTTDDFDVYVGED